MFELSEIEDHANHVNLSNLYEIAKKSAQIGNEILKVNSIDQNRPRVILDKNL